MKIAILGGAFNPPHLGHLLVAKQILEFTSQQQVWLMPCFQHSFQKDLLPALHRLKMTKLLKNGNIKYSDFEVKNKLSGDTFYTLKANAKKFPNHQFSFIIGSDNLADFKKWNQWEKLAAKFQILVFPRYDFNYNLKKYGLENKNYKFTLIKHPLLAKSDISSTLIRKRLTAGLSIDYLLPEKVRKYIKKNKLYY